MGQSKNPTTLVSFGDVSHELYLALGLSGFLLLTVLPLTIFLTNHAKHLLRPVFYVAIFLYSRPHCLICITFLSRNYVFVILGQVSAVNLRVQLLIN